MSDKTEGIHRFTLILPFSLWLRMADTAKKAGITVTDMVKRAVNLYFLVKEHEAKGEQLIFRSEDGKETLIHLL